MEELEELEDIRAYDQVKAQPSEPIPLKTPLGEFNPENRIETRTTLSEKQMK